MTKLIISEVNDKWESATVDLPNIHVITDFSSISPECGYVGVMGRLESCDFCQNFTLKKKHLSEVIQGLQLVLDEINRRKLEAYILDILGEVYADGNDHDHSDMIQHTKDIIEAAEEHLKDD